MQHWRWQFCSHPHLVDNINSCFFLFISVTCSQTSNCLIGNASCHSDVTRQNTTMVICYQTSRKAMHELSRDVTPMWCIQDHDVSVDIKPYFIQVPVKLFVSALEVHSQGTASLLKHGFLWQFSSPSLRVVRTWLLLSALCLFLCHEPCAILPACLQGVKFHFMGPIPRKKPIRQLQAVVQEQIEVKVCDVFWSSQTTWKIWYSEAELNIPARRCFT